MKVSVYQGCSASKNSAKKTHNQVQQELLLHCHPEIETAESCLRYSSVAAMHYICGCQRSIGKMVAILHWNPINFSDELFSLEMIPSAIKSSVKVVNLPGSTLSSKVNPLLKKPLKAIWKLNVGVLRQSCFNLSILKLINFKLVFREFSEYIGAKGTRLIPCLNWLCGTWVDFPLLPQDSERV